MTDSPRGLRPELGGEARILILTHGQKTGMPGGIRLSLRPVYSIPHGTRQAGAGGLCAGGSRATPPPLRLSRTSIGSLFRPVPLGAKRAVPPHSADARARTPHALRAGGRARPTQPHFFFLSFVSSGRAVCEDNPLANARRDSTLSWLATTISSSVLSPSSTFPTRLFCSPVRARHCRSTPLLTTSLLTLPVLNRSNNRNGARRH